MIIHRVRKPFMSREGQFEEGRHTLAVGLDLNTVKGNKMFRCYIGDNKKIYYEIESAEALRLAEQYKSEWKNPKGKVVLIIPVKDFEKKWSGWNEEEFEKKEKIRDKLNVQRRLL